ncbi:hypothetical protein BS47DRAFT_1304887 [Hydnum rufescens UP504]|uniref:DDE-1 domain-containing protein n=1 Tax=Hydnum rufescens UP504 TaxID=1448309 RepID=A0A9P6AJ18_9AGAM|nr:hypothetical protein BS47DRAFT_1304887 [Hydnum rufescens UP504]
MFHSLLTAVVIQSTDSVLVPYIVGIKKDLALLLTQRAILLINSWSVHQSEDYHNWMKDKHGLIKIGYIPAGCTGEIQSADVGLQHVIKHDIWTQCLEFLMTSGENNIKLGQNLSNVSLPDDLEQLQNENEKWITNTYCWLLKQPKVVKAVCPWLDYILTQ